MFRRECFLYVVGLMCRTQTYEYNVKCQLDCYPVAEVALNSGAHLSSTRPPPTSDARTSERYSKASSQKVKESVRYYPRIFRVIVSRGGQPNPFGRLSCHRRLSMLRLYRKYSFRPAVWISDAGRPNIRETYIPCSGDRGKGVPLVSRTIIDPLARGASFHSHCR